MYSPQTLYFIENEHKRAFDSDSADMSKMRLAAFRKAGVRDKTKLIRRHYGA